MAYITFINPPESTHRVAQRCLPPKKERTTLKQKFSFVKRVVVAELDYISRPRTHYEHLAKVLEEKRRLGLINY